MQAVEITQASVLIGGAGCPPAYAMASSGYVTHLIKNWRTPTETVGRTFRIVVARFQQASGISKPVFEHPSIPLQYVSGAICHAIRKYLSDIIATVRIRPNFVPPRLRNNDIAIMDRLLEYDHPFTEIQLRQINSCRLYLGVTYLSEISNITGTHLVSGIGDGDTSKLQCTPLNEKIYQPLPKTESWAIWDKLLQTFTIDPESTQLRVPLGAFTKDHSKHHRWNAYR